MPTLEELLAGAILVSLTIYALSGGADFGGGVWDLLASGPRREAQRRAIAEAIGPIWEANHVWLILVVVLLFTAFPPAFAAISTALFVPLTVALIGIVLRGAAFTFRSHEEGFAEHWGRVFRWASTITPVALGVSLGAVASGRITVEQGVVTCGFWRPWIALFPWAVGALALSLFAFLAAVYLANETKDEPLREDFRLRALFTALFVGVVAHFTRILSAHDAPRIHEGLSDPRFQACTAAVAIGALAALWLRRLRLARVLSVAQVVLIVWGWGGAQFPCLVEPSLTIDNSAAPHATLRPVAIALLLGALFLFPSFYWLMRVFKGKEAFSVKEP